MKILDTGYKKTILVILLIITFILIFIFELLPVPEKRVISYGLYGNNPLYTLGALKNAELAPIFYPGWTLVFYVDAQTVPADIIKGLKDRGATVITEGEFNGNMFGRFTIADNKDFDRFIVRDVDSRPSKREKEAVDEWIKSGKPMHNIRDHENHDELVMGGLWGGKNGLLRGQKMTDLINNWTTRDLKSYGQDQSFLADLLIPVVGIENLLSHDSYHCKKYPYSVAFPRPSLYKDFAGQIYIVDKDFNDKAVVDPGLDGSVECNPLSKRDKEVDKM